MDTATKADSNDKVTLTLHESGGSAAPEFTEDPQLEGVVDESVSGEHLSGEQSDETF